MGVSFTFLGSLLVISTNPDLGYEGMVGAIIMGGIFEGIVGLSAKYWRRFLTPVVSACVVIAIGLSLLSVGMDSWGGVSGVEDFGAWHHLFVGTFTLIVCLVSRYLLEGVYKNLNILVGLVLGYLMAIVFTVSGIAPMLDFSSVSQTISQVGYFSLPTLVFFTEHKPKNINQFLILVLFSQSQSYFLYLLPKQQVQQRLFARELYIVISRWKNYKDRWPWMGFQALFPVVLVVCL